MSASIETLCAKVDALTEVVAEMRRELHEVRDLSRADAVMAAGREARLQTLERRADRSWAVYLAVFSAVVSAGCAAAMALL